MAIYRREMASNKDATYLFDGLRESILGNCLDALELRTTDHCKPQPGLDITTHGAEEASLLAANFDTVQNV